MAGISSLTDRNAVLRAMAEYDQRGREAFLDHYHFGPAKWWYVVNDGKQYESKAIVGVAIGYQTGRPLTSRDFGGGEGTAIRRLKSLKFEVLRLPVSDATSRIPEEVGESYPEGLRTQVMVNRAERNPAARLACIEAHGVTCACCGMAFGEAYGSEFIGLIHVHHLTPLAGRTELRQVDPKKDLRPVCPNCHAAIHFGSENRSLDTIRTALKKAREAAV
jgi:5-methylcytosine-specific restriction enzyme A